MRRSTVTGIARLSVDGRLNNPARGAVLIELLVATTISSIVFAALLGEIGRNLLLARQGALESEVRRKLFHVIDSVRSAQAQSPGLFGQSFTWVHRSAAGTNNLGMRVSLPRLGVRSSVLAGSSVISFAGVWPQGLWNVIESQGSTWTLRQVGRLQLPPGRLVLGIWADGVAVLDGVSFRRLGSRRILADVSATWLTTPLFALRNDGARDVSFVRTCVPITILAVEDIVTFFLDSTGTFRRASAAAGQSQPVEYSLKLFRAKRQESSWELSATTEIPKSGITREQSLLLADSSLKPELLYALYSAWY